MLNLFQRFTAFFRRRRRPTTASLRLVAPLWPALVVLLSLLQLISPDRAWMALLVGIGGAWGIGYLWARSLAVGLRLSREIRFGWAQVGDRLQERYTLVNETWLPALWAEVTDHSNLPEYRAGRVTSVGYLSTVRWQTEGVCTRRGLYTLGPTSLLTGDPLGIYHVSLHLPESAALLVLPPVVPLPGIAIASGGRAGDGRQPRRAAHEQTVAANGVRPYQPGEPSRWIHWPTSARRESLFTRQFDHTPASDWWIFLDLERAAQVGQGWDSTEEHAIVLAASLAERGLRDGHAVGLAAQGRELIWLPPQNHPARRMELLQTLALAACGENPLADLLNAMRPAFHRGASLIVITPAVDGAWLAPLLRYWSLGITPTVLLLDPASFGATDRPNRAGALLAGWGVPHTLIGRELLDRPEARPGQRGARQRHFAGEGRAEPRRLPSDLQWRALQ